MQDDFVPLDDQPYDGRNLSYAGTFTNPFKALMIRIIELSTGKLRLLRLVRKFEAAGQVEIDVVSYYLSTNATLRL